METNNFSNGAGGLIFTAVLWLFAKITMADWANFAALLSGLSIFVINLPKAIDTFKKYFKK